MIGMRNETNRVIFMFTKTSLPSTPYESLRSERLGGKHNFFTRPKRSDDARGGPNSCSSACRRVSTKVYERQRPDSVTEIYEISVNLVILSNFGVAGPDDDDIMML